MALSEEYKRGWWRWVEMCLVEFHGKDATEAQRLAEERRLHLEREPPFPDCDGMIYHFQPIYESEAITGHRLSLTTDQFNTYVNTILGTSDG